MHRSTWKKRTLTILPFAATGLLAGLLCASLFVWYLAQPIHVYSRSYEPDGAEVTNIESIDPLPFVIGMAVGATLVGAVIGAIMQRKRFQCSGTTEYPDR